MIHIEATVSVTKAVQSQVAQINKLIAAGAQNILVANAPDIGAIPETSLISAGLLANSQSNQQKYQAKLLPEMVTGLSATYNFVLRNSLRKVEWQSGLDILEYNLFDYLTDQINNASELGYANTTEACIWMFSQGGTVNPACDFPAANTFLFWDEIHPTAKAHQGAGLELLDIISAQ